MNIKLFDKNQESYKLAILVKATAFREREIRQYYVQPLLDRGFARKDIIALSLVYNKRDKAPVSLIKEYLEKVKKILDHYNIKHILCADAAYFKVIAKVRKTEPHYGYVLPSIWPGIQVTPTINYQQLFYNPSLKSRLDLSTEAISKDMNNEFGLFSRDLLVDSTFLTKPDDIKNALDLLKEYPALTCDIETEGLEFYRSKILSISFGITENKAVTFYIKPNKFEIYYLLREFFTNYKGKLIFHNAIFDVKCIIYQIFMECRHGIDRMLHGLHVMFGNNRIEDTKILAYLSTNSTAGVSVSLKDLAFEYTGNYSVLSNDVDIRNMNPTTLMRYNATDALATWYVYNKYRNQVKQTQEDIYQNLFKPALKVLTQTEIVGMPFNKDKVYLAESELTDIKNKHYNLIMDSPIVQKAEKELRLEAVVSANAKLKKLIKTEEHFSDFTFNPNSHPQLQHLLYDTIKLPVQQYTDKGQPSTSSKTIEGLINWLKERYDL
jgi:DNA polymerase-1